MSARSTKSQKRKRVAVRRGLFEQFEARYMMANSAPEILSFGGNITFRENSTPVPVALTATVRDVDSADFATGSLLVSIGTGRSTSDRLTILDEGTAVGQIKVTLTNAATNSGFVAFTKSSNGTLSSPTIATFSGGIGNTPLTISLNVNATPVATQALLRRVAFSNISDNPTPDTRTIQVKLLDGDGGTSQVVSKSATVQAVNDLPIIGALGGTVRFTENGSPVLVSPTATVRDVDSEDFASGSLLVNIGSGRAITDRLTILNEGNAAGQIRVTVTNVTNNTGSLSYSSLVNGTLTSKPIGTFSGGMGNTPLTISLNANATQAATQALLRRISFSNISDNTNSNARTIQIRLLDGDGGTSSIASKLVGVTLVNDAPVIGTFGGNLQFTEAGPPTLISTTATLRDIDSPNFASGSLVVSIGVGRATTDRLTIISEGSAVGQIKVNVADTLTNSGSVAFTSLVNGTPSTIGIGTFSGGVGNTPLSVLLNANATQAATQALLRRIAFSNVSENPTTAARTVQVKLLDGDGGTSQTLSKSISVVPVNDAPILGSLGADGSFTENNDPVQIAATATLRDVDNENFNLGALVISIGSGRATTDRLTIVDEGSAAGQIKVTLSAPATYTGTVAYGAATIGTFAGGIGSTPLTISLNANATPAATQALLRRIAFSNVSENPTAVPRTISVKLLDGAGGTSQVVSKSIAVLPVNDTPRIRAIANNSMRSGETQQIPLVVQDPESIPTLSVSSSEGAVRASIVSGSLVLTAQDDFAGTANIDVSVTDGLEVSHAIFTVIVRGSQVSLVNDVLIIKGTGASDDIKLIGDTQNGQVAIYDGQELLQTFNRSTFNAISISAASGNDVVDLTALGFAIPTWIYGGEGQDRLLGGPGNDLIMGLAGADYISGGDGIDAIYGGENQTDLAADGSPVVLDQSIIVDGPGQNQTAMLNNRFANTVGGAGADNISLGTGWTEIVSNQQTLQVPGEDVNIEAMVYDDRVYFNLLNAYRDAFGYIWHPGPGADELGDSMQISGLAVVTAALRGDNAAVQSLLTVLRDRPFVNEHNDTRLIRHPLDMQTFESGGVMITQHKPVTKDGIVGVIPALHYAYDLDGMNADTKALAHDVMGKYIDYFIAHNWHTLYPAPEGFFERGTEVGPESFILGPNDRYALQNTAAQMGFLVSNWNVWGQWYSSIVEEVNNAIDVAATGLANKIGDKVDSFLQQLAIHMNYSFHVIPSVDWTRVSGSLDVEIPTIVRETIVTTFETELKLLITSGANIMLTAGTDQSPTTNVVFQTEDLLGRLVDNIVDALPDWAGADRWYPAVTSAIQQALPWIRGEVIGEVFAFVLAHQMAKGNFLEGDVKPDLVHLAFWPTLVEMKTRPDMVDLIGWSVEDLNGYIGTDHVFHTEFPAESGDFGIDNLYKMDMGPFIWLSGDQNKTDWWLYQFRNDRRFDAIRYAWKVEHEEVLNGKNGGLPGVLDGDPTGHKDFGFNKLDFMLLEGLNQNGRPDSATEIVGDWLDHWGDVLRGLRDDFAGALKQGWDDLRSDLVGFAQRLHNEFDATLNQLANALWGNVTNNIGNLANALYGVLPQLRDVAAALWSIPTASIAQVAEGLYDITSDLGSIAEALYDGVTTNLTSIAGALYDGVTSNISAIADALWDIPSSTIPGIARAIYDGITDSLGEIAQAIYDGVTHSLGEIAEGIWDMGIGGITVAQVADALWDIPTSTIPQIARAIHDSISSNLTTIVNAIYDGITHTLSSIASGIWNMGIGGITRAQIADALWDLSSSTIPQIARAIYDGISTNLSGIAIAIYDGITHSLTQISSGIWTMGIGGITQSQIADALWDIPSSTLPGIARSLYDGITTNLSNIVTALYNGITHTLSDIAGALWNMGIGGINKSQITSALLAVNNTYHDLAYAIGAGIGGYLWELVDCLRSISASWESAATALWYSDIDALFGGIDAFDLGRALRDARASFESVISALQSALNYTYARALAVANAIF